MMPATPEKPTSTPIPVQLSESEFNQFIWPHLSLPKRGPKCKLGYHRVFNLILWVLYTGMQWKCLPVLKDSDGKTEIHYTTVYKVFARWSDDGSLEHAFIASVAHLSDQHQLDLRVLHGDGTNTVAKKGGDGIGYSGHKHQKGEKVIAIIDNNGYVLAPLPVASVNEADTVLLPEGLKTLKRVAKLTGLGLTGSYLNLDGGFDSKSNRKAIFNAGMIPNIKENPRHRKSPKRGRKRLFNAAMHVLRDRVERTFAWEDKFKRLLLRFEHIQQRHYGMKLMAYTIDQFEAFLSCLKLATSSYEFELRQGVTFHNGDPFTAEDVQFSFERYHGAGATELKKQVKALEMLDPHHLRFVLHAPRPDFLTFYATPATGAGWIVPKHYTETIGNDAFKNHPVGLGPYRFVSYNPGVELVLEANTDYWRKMPSVKRLVFKSVPDPTTRLAMLKNQEADVTYAIYGTLGEEVQRDKTLKLEATLAGTEWGVFVDMYDPASPWHDPRVRRAANHALNRQALNEAETLGYSKLLGGIIPETYDFALPLEPYAYDPQQAKALLTAAGYPRGFDAGEFSCDTVYADMIEGVVNDLWAIGIRAKVQGRERAAMQTAQREKTVKNLTRMGSGAPGNAATRIEAFMVSTGVQSFLKDPDIDQWFEQQSRERDRTTREALLHKIQQKVYDEAYFLPIWQLGFLCVTGPRVAVSGLGLIPGHIYSAPYEEVQLKA